MGSAVFEIAETRRGEWVRLSLAGELDASTAPALDNRVHALRVERKNVYVDLSELEFIDCAGGHVLAAAIAESQQGDWQVELEPGISGQPERFITVLRATGVSPYL